MSRHCSFYIYDLSITIPEKLHKRRRCRNAAFLKLQLELPQTKDAKHGVTVSPITSRNLLEPHVELEFLNMANRVAKVVLLFFETKKI